MPALVDPRFARYPVALHSHWSHTPPHPMPHPLFSLPAYMRATYNRAVITPAQRHEREAADSRRRLRTSLLLLAVSALAHLGHHAHHLLPLGAFAHVPLFSASFLPAGWFDWLQAGVATAALVGPGNVARVFLPLWCLYWLTAVRNLVGTLSERNVLFKQTF